MGIGNLIDCTELCIIIGSLIAGRNFENECFK